MRRHHQRSGGRASWYLKYKNLCWCVQTAPDDSERGSKFNDTTASVSIIYAEIVIIFNKYMHSIIHPATAF